MEALRETLYYKVLQLLSDPDTRAEALNPVAHIDYVLTGWLILAWRGGVMLVMGLRVFSSSIPF